MNENDENVDPMRDVGDIYDKLLVEIGEEVFGLDAREGENFDGLRDRYIDQLIEEIEEDLRRDFEMDDEDEDEDDPYDNDEMEPDPPRQPARPFRNDDVINPEHGKIARWRRQHVAERVGGNDEPIFTQMGDPGLARDELSDKCGVTPQIFWEIVDRCRASQKWPDGEDVAVKDREKGKCGRGIPIPLAKKVFCALWMLKCGYSISRGRCQSTFGIGKSTMGRFFTEFVKFVSKDLMKEEVFYNYEMLKANEAFYRKLGKPGAVASIDGTILYWKNCPEHLRQYCRYHKTGGYALNVQISVNAQLRILNIGTIAGGSSNDNILFRDDEFVDFVANDPECENSEFIFYAKDEDTGEVKEVTRKGMLLIGDGIYQQDVVISRFLRSGGRVNGDTPEARWNNHHGSVRKDVERVIGLLKMVWKILAEDIWFKNVETIQDVLNTCAYLHNRILRHNGRDQFGTQDDHFNPLRPDFDAEALQRYHDDFEIPPGLVEMVETNNIVGHREHNVVQIMSCAHFFIALQKNEVKWPKMQSTVFPTNPN